MRQARDVPAPTSTEGKCVAIEQRNKVVEVKDASGER